MGMYESLLCTSWIRREGRQSLGESEGGRLAHGSDIECRVGAMSAGLCFHRRGLMQSMVSEAPRIVGARVTLGLPCDPEGPLVVDGVWSGEGEALLRQAG